MAGRVVLGTESAAGLDDVAGIGDGGGRGVRWRGQAMGHECSAMNVEDVKGHESAACGERERVNERTNSASPAPAKVVTGYSASRACRTLCMSSTPVFALQGWKTRVSHLSVRVCPLVVASCCRYRDACFAFAGLRSRLLRPFLPGSGRFRGFLFRRLIVWSCCCRRLLGPIIGLRWLVVRLGFPCSSPRVCSGTNPMFSGFVNPYPAT
ncbi:hypothetical protein C8R44DRAFT_395011 [Mycena epipterygia]|nr:hypothetical protein C8R44DRAFT_395011 [Mycena epipterygia]